MTVGELIELLSSYPVDMTVVRVNHDVDYGTEYFRTEPGGVAVERMLEVTKTGQFYFSIQGAEMAERKFLVGARDVLTLI